MIMQADVIDINEPGWSPEIEDGWLAQGKYVLWA
jgi:hypothetical protein